MWGNGWGKLEKGERLLLKVGIRMGKARGGGKIRVQSGDTDEGEEVKEK